MLDNYGKQLPDIDLWSEDVVIVVSNATACGPPVVFESTFFISIRETRKFDNPITKDK